MAEAGTLIAAAIAVGATARRKMHAGMPVADAVANLEALLDRDYPEVELRGLFLRPDSAKERGLVVADLIASGAARNPETLRRTVTLLQAVLDFDPTVGDSLSLSVSHLYADALASLEHGPEHQDADPHNVDGAGQDLDDPTSFGPAPPGPKIVPPNRTHSP